MTFDYYYGVEAEQFSFYRIPRILIKDKQFKGLSSDAKLLYGLMLDRMSLSMKNGWLDEENRVYIIYTIDNIMEDLGCARATCVKIIKELDSDNGIGLIEKKRKGLGRPDIIYVKNFVVSENKKSDETVVNADKADKSTEIQELNLQKFKNYTSGSSKAEFSEVQNLDFQKFKKQISRNSEIELAEVQKLDSNYTDYSYTNYNYIDSNYTNQNNTDVCYVNPINPINQSGESEQKTELIDTIDELHTYRALIRGSLEYEQHMNYDKQEDKELFEEIYEIICDVVCVKRKIIRINGEEYPYELVKSRFLKLNSSHVDYVMDCMKSTVTKIVNIRSYLITALYNAPATMNHYYKQEVQHDMYGGYG